MDVNVVCVDAAETVIEVANKMIQNDVWSVVVNKRGLPVGVVTDRDMITRCLSKGLNAKTASAEEIMSSPVIAIGPEESLTRAVELMQEKRIRRVFVVEDGKIIGRVTQTAACGNLFDLIAGLSTVSGVI